MNEIILQKILKYKKQKKGPAWIANKLNITCEQYYNILQSTKSLYVDIKNNRLITIPLPIYQSLKKTIKYAISNNIGLKFYVTPDETEIIKEIASKYECLIFYVFQDYNYLYIERKIMSFGLCPIAFKNSPNKEVSLKTGDFVENPTINILENINNLIKEFETKNNEINQIVSNLKLEVEKLHHINPIEKLHSFILKCTKNKLNFMIKVNPETSKIVQNILFSYNIDWFNDSKSVLFANDPYLYVIYRNDKYNIRSCTICQNIVYNANEIKLFEF